MTLEELDRLLEPEIQAMIALHQGDDPAQFAMQFHARKELPVRAMAEQIACLRKAAKKLPALYGFNLLYTPLSLEQASGERSAVYKAALLTGKKAIDLSGGLGVDTMFLARAFKEVVYCERDPLLCAVVEHNLKVSGVANVEIKNGESIGLLAGFPDNSFECIYVDPARREEGRRSVTLESASPDVVVNHDLLLRKAAKVCIKASPALELSNLKTLLPALSEIVVVSVDRECKESLLLLDRGARDRPVTIRAVALSTGSDAVVEVCGDPDADRAVASSLKEFLYEPDPAIIKARLSAVLARNCGLEFLNGSVDYLTGEQLIADFPGRLFQVLERVPWKPKTFRAFLDRHHITGASIQRRDFPLSVEELRKRYCLGESERAFLFFTRNAEREPVVIYALRFFAEAGSAPPAQGRNATPGC
ncbi:hypothetical protein G9409_03705 [Chlorobium sp. BLA1]|uniref:class I SAM-dependent methyltransferase n=1 Tax=Candidatus Chlorobium masyuteum TaxID=2716876 RepID=UPI00141FBE01|nr:class I SAM-dependent methyltransferase [Candidatus Chlorobium masyuteum]NHQ59701.1 hypothetical protein [Candidatus Chlorobium masyuteum]